MQRISFTAWHYDAKLHALIGAVSVWPELCESGEQIYRLPPCTTLIEPPQVEPGAAAVFLESTQHWVTVSDHRGETWVDGMGRVSVIERLGNPEHWDMKPCPIGGSGSPQQSVGCSCGS